MYMNGLIAGLVIKFVDGMIGLVLGVVRFPVVMVIETSVSITAGTNLGVSTLGKVTAVINHYSQKKYSFVSLFFWLQHCTNKGIDHKGFH
jgi:uncharacterized membrane protein YfcA